MTFLPIVLRELRVAARRRATYRARLLAALVAILVVGWMLLTYTAVGFSTSVSGQSIFYTLATFAFGYCLLAGTRNTADCISEEKRDGTLGLLFLTDLKGHDVALGKLAATSLNSFYALLAIFPVLAIALLFGGITGDQLFRMALLLVNTLFFSLTAGLLVSALSRNERKAMLGTLALIGLVTAGLPGLGFLFESEIIKSPSPEAPLATLLPSPAYAYAQVFAGNFGMGVDEKFWWSLLTTNVIGCGFLALASFALPRAWQEKSRTVRMERWENRLRFWVAGDAARCAGLRRRLLQINPVLWLTHRDGLQSLYLWVFIAACALIWLWGSYKYKKDWQHQEVYVMTALIVHTVLKIWLAAQAGRQFAEDRRSGALELLLGTPLSVKEILRGQLLTLRRQFTGPLLVVLLADVCFLLAGSQESSQQSGWVWTCLAGIGILLADVWAIAWLGMWLGLSGRQANRVASAVMGRILVLPWVAFWMFMTFFSLWAAFFRAYSSYASYSELMVIGVWFILGLANDLLWGTWAKIRLHRDFRRVAMQRYEGRKPSWVARWLVRRKGDRPAMLAG